MIDLDSVVPADEPIGEAKRKFRQEIAELKAKFDLRLNATCEPDETHHHFWTRWQIEKLLEGLELYGSDTYLISIYMQCSKSREQIRHKLRLLKQCLGHGYYR